MGSHVAGAEFPDCALALSIRATASLLKFWAVALRRALAGDNQRAQRAFGIVLGLALTMALARFADSIEYSIHPNDPVTFILVAAAVAAVSILAAYLPARRASQIAPLVALREE